MELISLKEPAQIPKWSEDALLKLKYILAFSIPYLSMCSIIHHSVYWSCFGINIFSVVEVKAIVSASIIYFLLAGIVLFCFVLGMHLIERVISPDVLRYIPHLIDRTKWYVVPIIGLSITIQKSITLGKFSWPEFWLAVGLYLGAVIKIKAFYRNFRWVQAYSFTIAIIWFPFVIVSFSLKQADLILEGEKKREIIFVTSEGINFSHSYIGEADNKLYTFDSHSQTVWITPLSEIKYMQRILTKKGQHWKYQ